MLDQDDMRIYVTKLPQEHEYLVTAHEAGVERVPFVCRDAERSYEKGVALVRRHLQTLLDEVNRAEP